MCVPEADRRGPQVTEERNTSEKALSAFKVLCAEQSWVFAETNQKDDYGKDGYLDLSKSGELDGRCVAVQVKGGKSYRSSDGHQIDANKRQRRVWLRSTVPVFGIVWDPDGSLYWLNISDTLNRHGEVARLHVPDSNVLDGEGLSKFQLYVLDSVLGSHSMFAFGSTDADLQKDAIWDCYGLGRRDPEYLIMLRRVMFSLEPDAFRLAVNALDTCSLNFDNLIDTKWMKLEDRDRVRESFVWSVDEAVELLDSVYDDGNGYFGRASYGSGVYWLIVGSEPYGDHFYPLVEAAMRRAIDDGRLHAAAMGLILWLFWQKEQGAEALRSLLQEFPVLKSDDEVKRIQSFMDRYGKIEL